MFYIFIEKKLDKRILTVALIFWNFMNYDAV